MHSVIAGEDATEAFYGLHRQEVLERPQYQRLQIGTVRDEPPLVLSSKYSGISPVPYGEPTWLSPGFHSPYYTDVRKPLKFFYKFDINLVIIRVTADFRRLSVNLSTHMFALTLRRMPKLANDPTWKL
jgi:hypothetical protein